MNKEILKMIFMLLGVILGIVFIVIAKDTSNPRAYTIVGTFILIFVGIMFYFNNRR
jgi:hypothetical protein